MSAEKSRLSVARSLLLAALVLLSTVVSGVAFADHAADGTIEGNVETAMGDSKNIQVQVINETSGDAIRNFTVDETSSTFVSVSVPGGHNYTVKVSEELHNTVETNTLQVSENGTVDFGTISLSTTGESEINLQATTEGQETDTRVIINDSSGTEVANRTHNITGQNFSEIVQTSNGPFEVTVTADGHNPVTKSISMPSDDRYYETFDLNLTEPGTVEGTVTLDQDSGVNSTVSLVDSNGDVVDQALEIPSGGNYTISHTAGEYTLRFEAQEYQTVETSVTIQENTATQVNETLTPRDPYISGQITPERDDYTGDVDITVTNSSGATVNQSTETVSGGIAEYLLRVPETGDYTVNATATGYTPNDTTVTISTVHDSKDNVNLQLYAEDRGELNFTAISSDGDASSINLRVIETGDTATISDGGTETFDLPTGDLTMRVSADGYETKRVNVTNSPGSPPDEYSTTLAPADGVISGTVNASGASDSQDFTVSLAETSNQTTVQDGDSFSFTVDPGDYTLNASATDFNTDSQTVTVQSESTTSVTLEPYKPTTVNATVSIENTSTASEATVAVSETGNSYTVSNGSELEITDLKPGKTYTITASADGHTMQTKEVTPDTNGANVSFTLLESSSGTGFVAINASTEDGGASSIDVLIEETGQTLTLNDGEVRQVELAANRNYTLTANANGYNESTKQVTVTANEASNVQFSLGAEFDANVSGVKIESGNSYWLGQEIWRIDLNDYDKVQWKNQLTTVSFNRSINTSAGTYQDTVQAIINEGGANNSYTFYGVNDSGNTQIADVYVGIQYVNASFTPSEAVDTASVEFESNRDSYSLFIEQNDSDANQLTNQEIADLFATGGYTTSVETVNGTEGVVVEVTSASSSNELNVSELERANYDFNFSVLDTPAEAQASAQLVSEEFETKPDAEVSEEGRYWLGQRLEFNSDSISAGETVSVFHQEGQFEQELQADELGDVQIRTTDIGVGDFYIENSSGVQLVNFSVQEQTLTANFTDSTVLNGGTQTESGLTLDSNRAAYDVTIKANYTDPETDEIESMETSALADALDLETSEVNGETQVVAKDISNLQTLIANFENASAGEYKFTMDVVDAEATASANITVESPAAGQVLFTDQFYTHNRGDIAEFTIDFSGDANSAIFNLGSEERVGYEIKANISKQSNISQANIYFDTSKAGQGTPDEVLYAENDSVDVDVLRETDIPIDGKLQSARYLMELKVDNQTTALSTFNLFESGVESGDFYGVSPTVSSVGNTETVLNNSVPMDEIDNQTYVTLGFQVTGLGVQLDNPERTPSDFAPGAAFAEQTGMSITLEKDDAGQNQPTETVDISNALQYHYEPLNTSDENNTAMMFFVFEPDNFNTEGDGTYEATLNITDENAFVSQSMNASTSFTFIESNTTFDRHWSGDLLVTSDANQTISGTTTLPPGTTLTHELRSENVRYPFYASKTVNISENGTFNATYDLSGVPVGLEFNTSIQGQTQNKTVEVVSEIEPRPPEEMTNVTVFTQANGIPVEAEVTLGGENLSTSGQPPLASTYLQQGTYQITGEVTADGETVSIDRAVTLDANNEDLIVNMTSDGGSIERGDPREKPEKYNLTVNLEGQDGASIDGLVELNGQQKVVVNGTVTFRVTQGSYTAIAQSYGYETQQEDVTITGDDVVTITLPNDPSVQDGGVTNDSNTTNNTTTTNPTTTTPGQPGFGFGLAIAAFLGAALFARRRL